MGIASPLNGDEDDDPGPCSRTGPRGPRPVGACAGAEGTVTSAHLLAIAAAVAGGGLVTLLVMTSTPGGPRGVPCRRVPRRRRGRARHDRCRPGAPAPAWSSRNQSRWISNPRKNAAFELEANQPVAVWLKQVRPTLVVRCMDKRTDVFVYTDSAARIEEQDENHTVRVAFDDDGRHARAMARLGGTRRAVCARRQGHGRTAARRAARCASPSRRTTPRR